MRPLLLSLTLIVMMGAATQEPAWAARMQVLAAALSELVPFLVNAQEFRAPENQKRIQTAADVLAETARDVEMHASRAPLDPMIPMLGHELAANARDARQALAAGHTEYARRVLLSVTQQCIACHTRSELGPQSPALFMRPDTPELAPVDRAMVLTATRQFDRALIAWRGVLSDDELARRAPETWRKALVQSLAITVRVKANPAAALHLLDDALDGAGPRTVRAEEIQAWRQSIAAWRAERDVPSTEDAMYTRAVMLASRASALQGPGLGDRALVEELRASAALHQLLEAAPQGRHAPEAMLLLGETYEFLVDIDDGALSHRYYAACVRARPASAVAQECFNRYEAAMRAAFTGSSGTNLPDDVAKDIESLRALARPSSR